MLLGVTLIILTIILFICIAMALGLGECVKDLWKLFFSVKPKTGIDKEIAEEEKEIAELERQKEKMETLEELKRRKERLFEEVRGETNMDCQWCGADDCLQPAYTVDGISQYYCTSCHRWLYESKV